MYASARSIHRKSASLLRHCTGISRRRKLRGGDAVFWRDPWRDWRRPHRARAAPCDWSGEGRRIDPSHHPAEAGQRHTPQRTGHGGGGRVSVTPVCSASGTRTDAIHIMSRPSRSANDHDFSEKLESIVGLYLDPPEHALRLVSTKRAKCKRLIERSLCCRLMTPPD